MHVSSKKQDSHLYNKFSSYTKNIKNMKNSFLIIIYCQVMVVSLFFSLLIDVIFQSNFRFTKQLSKKYRESLYRRCPCGHSLFHYQHPGLSGPFVTTDETTLTHNNHSKSIVYMRVHSCTFCGFGEMHNDVYPLQYTEQFHCPKSPLKILKIH